MRNKDVIKFHGMKVVNDFDLQSVKGNGVVEMTSGGDIVYRRYDENGLEESDSCEIDIYQAFGQHPKTTTEANITGSIKRQIGSKNILISESVVKLIQKLVSDD